MEPVSPPLKILQIVSGTDVNGALVHCRLLSRELSRRGHDVTIACRTESWLWSQLDDCSLRLVTCEMERWPLAGLRRFADWIRRERFDVLHTHMSSAHMFGIIMKRLTGVPVVATAHSRHVQPWWRLNDRVIANSKSTASFQQRINLVNRCQIATINCFVDTTKFREPGKNVYRAIRRQWRFKPDTRVIVIAGAAVPYKGHMYLFQGLPEMIRQIPDLRVVVVGRFKRGEWYTDRLRKYLVQENLFKRVKWIGRRNNMHEILSAADVVAIPSIVESFGMVALESMAAGTPVVATATGGLKELIDHENDGLLVPARDSGALAKSVLRLFSDPELREKLIAGGQKTVANRYAPEKLTRQIEHVLWQACQPTNSRSAA